MRCSFKMLCILFAINLVFGGIAVLQAEELKADEVLAEYEGGKITTQDLNDKLDKIPPMQRDRYKTIDGKKQVLDVICTERLYYQEGLALGKDTDPGVLDQIEKKTRPVVIRSYRDNEFKKDLVVTDEDKRKFYDENRETMYKEKPNYSILYIQVEDWDAARAANQMFEEGKDFVDVMNQYSVNEFSRKRAGKIDKIKNNGYIQGVGRDAVLDSLIANAPMHQMMGPDSTETGIHFFKVTDFEPAHYKEYEEVEKQIEARLRPIKESELYMKETEDLFAEFKIVIDNDLVQGVNVNDDSLSTEELQKKVVTSSKPEFEVTVADLIDMKDEISSEQRAQFQSPESRIAIVKRNIEDRVFFFDAKRKGYLESEDVKETLDQIRYAGILRAAYDEIVVQKVEVNDEILMQTYEQDKEKYAEKPYRKIRAFHFETEKQAKKAMKKAKKYTKKDKMEDLVELIQESSLFTRNDGVIDNIRDNNIIPNVGKDNHYSELVWSTEVGEFSEIFESAKGEFVFFQVLEETPLTYKDFETVKSTISANLYRKLMREKFEAVTKELEEKYNLVKHEDKLDMSLSAEELFNMAEDAQKRKRYNDAVSYYDQIIKVYKNGDDDYKATFMKAFLYSEELKDNEKAKELFQSVINDFPSGDLHESAEFMMKSLDGDEDFMENLKE